ncbi:DnaJ domain-containing protein [Decorospora gaudefroyi]|uniref:DnaJ domain-containing protein n=1 Tax=Decorospora gaudefroyi TaxID=184978 RepID=A0A6A5KQP1_9PLEO|nr:DnaJ domain-containing protein [Decorospora gaudefroyi]
MGASQSRGGGETPGVGGEVKTSYYELLGVDRTATQDELKKAYRKKALELHPDRNYGDVERTTALFAEVRSAYEVLSDDQERAWYDAHEGDILRGGTGEGASEDHYQGNMRVTTADDLARMMGKFRGNVDFSDSPNGFFGFVREAFEQLAREEAYAADYDDIDIPDYPSFGHKDDGYDSVVRDFYASWNAFATAKSFAWLDRYRLSDAPDRRTRRLMEKENQKFRDDGKREFNDAVRTLVAFVRKRDPRYTPNTQTDEEKAKAQRDARKAQAARARAAQLAKLEQEAQALPTWATERPPDELEEESEQESEEEHFECVACNKTFKSERQYEAHEKSKKHQKAIQSLKRKMQKDNAHLNLDEDALSSGVLTPANEESGADTTAPEAHSLDDPVSHLAGKTEELNIDDETTDSEVTDRQHPVRKEADSGAGASPAVEPDEASEDDEDDEYASRSDIEARLAPFSSTNTSTAPTEGLDTKPTDHVEPDEAAPQEPKLGKAAQKRAKKAAKQSEVDESDAKNKCAGCDAAFPSKTRLHQHLKDHPKHAALKTVAGGGKKTKKR